MVREPLAGFVLEELPGRFTREGDARVLPADAQVEVCIEGLVALGDAREVDQEEAHRHLHGTRAGWEGQLVRTGRRCDEEDQEHGRPAHRAAL